MGIFIKKINRFITNYSHLYPPGIFNTYLSKRIEAEAPTYNSVNTKSGNMVRRMTIVYTGVLLWTKEGDFPGNVPLEDALMASSRSVKNTTPLREPTKYIKFH